MVKRLLSFACLFLACTVAYAQGSVFLEDLTWPEIRAATSAGKTTILVPIGGTEQNGPHMAVGKHNVRARWFARKIAEKLGDALVAPVIAYVPEGTVNPPVAHMRFPGTITIPEEVFEKTLESAARGFRLHGFKDIVFLGDHGGYQKGLARVAERLDREWKDTSVRVHPLPEYYQAQTSGFAELLRRKGYTDAQIGTHAGLSDTALTLAIDPSLVRADRLGAASTLRADGVHGDPRAATAELGRLGTELVIERSVEAIRKATARR